MTCLAAERERHRALARRLAQLACVLDVDYVAPTDSPSGRWETVVVLERAFDGVPRPVALAIYEEPARWAGVEIADVSAQGGGEYLVVCVK